MVQSLGTVEIGHLILAKPGIDGWQGNVGPKLTSMLVIGHGDLANRQRRGHELLLKTIWYRVAYNNQSF